MNESRKNSNLFSQFVVIAYLARYAITRLFSEARRSLFSSRSVTSFSPYLFLFSRNNRKFCLSFDRPNLLSYRSSSLSFVRNSTQLSKPYYTATRFYRRISVFDCYSGQLHIISSDHDDSDEEYATNSQPPRITSLPNTSRLDVCY